MKRTKKELLEEIERLKTQISELKWRNEDLKLKVDVLRNTLEGHMAWLHSRTTPCDSDA